MQEKYVVSVMNFETGETFVKEVYAKSKDEAVKKADADGKFYNVYKIK